MASRFNTLYLGQPGDAVNELEEMAVDGTGIEKYANYLRLTLINAMRRIAELEEIVEEMRR